MDDNLEALEGSIACISTYTAFMCQRKSTSSRSVTGVPDVDSSMQGTCGYSKGCMPIAFEFSQTSV